MSSIETLLMRFEMPEAIPALKEMKVEKVVALRRLTEAQLEQVFPDPVKRMALMEAISNRGNHQPSAGPPPMATNPPQYAEADGRYDDGFETGRGGGASRGRSGNSRGRSRGGRGGHGGRGGGDGDGDMRMRTCRQFFNNGCKYGDNCRYSHSMELLKMEREVGGIPPRSNDNIGQHEKFEEAVDIPAMHIKYLLANRGADLRAIHDQFRTSNKRFEHFDDMNGVLPLILCGPSAAAVTNAKEAILAMIDRLIGVRKQGQQMARFQYARNELQANQRAIRLLIIGNKYNKGTPNELSESVLQRVTKTFRFVKQQEIKHFWVGSGQHDRDKLETVSKIVNQLKGVQALLFCDSRRVVNMINGSQKLSRYFNGATPQFVSREVTKENRMAALEAFKKGEVNEHGVKQRLLVTSEDYAKFARKHIVPYVNLVINFSVPKSAELYMLQAMVSGRHGTQGASVLFVNTYEQPLFHELEKTVPFEEFKDERSFSETAAMLSYDTTESCLTPENADPPSNWREILQEEMAAKAAAREAASKSNTREMAA